MTLQTAPQSRIFVRPTKKQRAGIWTRPFEAKSGIALDAATAGQFYMVAANRANPTSKRAGRPGTEAAPHVSSGRDYKAGRSVRNDGRTGQPTLHQSRRCARRMPFNRRGTALDSSRDVLTIPRVGTVQRRSRCTDYVSREPSGLAGLRP